MRLFLLGFLCAGLLGAVGLWRWRDLLLDPCQACAAGTRCDASRCVPAMAQQQPPTPPRRRGGRSTAQKGPPQHPAAGPGPETPESPPVDAPPPVILTAADQKLVTAGDKLSGTEVVDFNSADRTDRELEQEDLDAVFRPRQQQIISCLDQARGEAQLTSHMTVAFRVQRSGQVGGVRVEAPAYLLQHGLYECIRSVVQALRFPPSAKAQVVTYPFSLR